MLLRKAILLLLLIPAASVAQSRERLPRPCLREIMALCRGEGRDGIAACLRERAAQLSEGCRTVLRDRVRMSFVGNMRETGTPSAVVRYGEDERQAADYYPAATGARPQPLVLFIHGGGWAIGNRAISVQNKPAWFSAHGYAFASTGYRLLPAAPVEEQARDVARAIHAMRANAARLGFDPDRIVLMGHSAGAHLAALVATDPSYAGADFPAIKGVILLDGAGYDVAANMASERPEAAGLYRNAFGTDPARQRALSPVTRATAPNAPDWLILHVAARAASGEQSRLLGDRLRAAGAHADVVGIDNTNHGQLNRNLGTADDPATARVEAFLARLFPN